jgi:alkaline phosphatase D
MPFLDFHIILIKNAFFHFCIRYHVMIWIIRYRFAFKRLPRKAARRIGQSATDNLYFLHREKFLAHYRNVAAPRHPTNVSEYCRHRRVDRYALPPVAMLWILHVAEAASQHRRTFQMSHSACTSGRSHAASNDRTWRRMQTFDETRRRLLRRASAALGLGVVGLAPPVPAAPAIRASGRCGPPLGMQLGDPSTDGLVIWARADRPARMIVEFSNDPDFRRTTCHSGPLATDATDLTARMLLRCATPGQTGFVRVAFECLEESNGRGPWLDGAFRLPAPTAAVPIRFLWSGDMCGQGWGINPEIGGVKIYRSMRLRRPDFFIHSGDTVYADSPISAEVTTVDGRIWKNIVTDDVAKVAETAKEFRGRYRYNMLDENVLDFSREVPQIWQWDDHEVVNNYSAAKDLSTDTRYTVKDVGVLAARGQRAFLENAPMRSYRNIPDLGSGYHHGWESGWAHLPDRVYRHIPYGPRLDVFVLDMRRYRGPNTANLQPVEGKDTALLGAQQVDWLVTKLARSRATWKVIAADMPIGLYVQDGADTQGSARWEAVANGTDGPALGRELEIARLLTHIKAAGVKNVVWLTADVHYCAAHYYAPENAGGTDFDPFWEFVAGPLNAGSFGPNELDGSFGPKVVFQKASPLADRSPFGGYQFFGEVDIDPYTGEMTVDLRDVDGVSQFSRTIAPRE